MFLPAVLATSLALAPNANPAVTISVNATANRHPISPLIYGVSWADASTMSDLGLTLNRWGGNAMSRYNWAISTSNRCKDYYFENIPDAVSSGDGSNGKSADDFIGRTFAAGAQPVITIPTMGILPKDRAIRCGYSVSKYGAQQYTDPYRPDCGNGVTRSGARMRFVNTASDTSATYTSVHQANWVQHLVDTWGTAAAGGVRYYSLDNEPSLWSADHWDVHPNGSTYDEVWSKMAEYGAAIKAKDSSALITGPDEWGWSAYFDSGIDAENHNEADRNAHGGTAYIDWILQRAKAYEQTNGVRILDFLAVHFYPQGGEFSNDTSSTMQTLRNRSTRSLWDPTYVNESWIASTGIDGGHVRLIPRLKEGSANQYPGTKTGITEYNWGAENHINGGTAQADILGIMGREGLDMGVRWTGPQPGTFTFNAFRMYRNYDGNHSRFGDTSISATGPNPDNVAAFAAVRSADAAMTIMIIAKSLTGTTPATVNLANFVPYRAAAAQRWQLDSSNAIAKQADLTLSGSSLSLTLPAQSITLLVLPGATPPDAPAIGSASPGNGSATIAFAAPTSDGGSSITGYTATCNPGTISGSGAASPIAVNGLTNGVSYACSVAALNAAGTSGPSGTVNVTPVGGSPTGFVATATGTSDVSLAWNPVAGASSYEIHRSVAHSDFVPLKTSSNAASTDSGLTQNTTYLYRVRAITPNGPTAFSAVDAATTIVFNDDPLNAGTAVKATHVAQLRIAVNAMRTAAGLQASSFTDSPLTSGTQIKAAHVVELRTALDAARITIGLTPLAYVDDPISVRATKTKAAHVTELRNGVK